MTDEWRPIPGWSGYEASQTGQIRSIDRVVVRSDGVRRRFHGQVLRQKVAKQGGYRVVSPCGSTQYVHVLVLLAFVGPRPDGMDGCHGDGDPGNNRIDNLRWDTRSGNVQDTIRLGRHNELMKSTCPRQHLLTAPNLVASAAKKGHRGCRACARARGRCARAVRRGVGLDFQIEADRAYARIMTLAVA